MCLSVAMEIFDRYPTKKITVSYNQYGEIVKVEYTNVEGRQEVISVTPKTGDTNITDTEIYSRSYG